jgi:signal transduction histidine kinase
MAHRIKNILMGLEGGLFVVNTAFETKDDEVAAQGWEMIERNISKVSQVAKDLLYCAKRRPPNFKEGVVPQQIAKDVHDLFGKRAAAEGIDIVIDNGEAHRATLDPDGLHALITNLVTNAIDACRFDTDENKKRHRIILKVASSSSGDTVITVEDDGSGIPEEMSEKVFEDFFSTKGTEGTGLGLLVIKRIVEEHGGNISFVSEQGRGTTFTVTLPSRPREAIAPPSDIK